MSDEAPAVTGMVALVVDCSDPPALARWWAQLLSGDVNVDADGDAALRMPGGLVLDFLKVPETKGVKNRLHIDLRTNDLAAATEQVLRLGATRAIERNLRPSSIYTGDGPPPGKSPIPADGGLSEATATPSWRSVGADEDQSGAGYRCPPVERRPPREGSGRTASFVIAA